MNPSTLVDVALDLGRPPLLHERDVKGSMRRREVTLGPQSCCVEMGDASNKVSCFFFGFLFKPDVLKTNPYEIVLGMFVRRVPLVSLTKGQLPMSRVPLLRDLNPNGLDLCPGPLGGVWDAAPGVSQHRLAGLERRGHHDSHGAAHVSHDPAHPGPPGHQKVCLGSL